MITSFGPGHVSVDEFNALLLEIVGLETAQFCKQKDAEGLTRAEINVLLVDHLEELERWRSKTLQEFKAFALSA